MSLDERLRSVFASVFGLDPARVQDDDSYETIPEWDSVNHINLILALEAEFGVEFDPGEIAELGSVAAIRARLGGMGE
jgi:acyl carrier protein